MGPYRISVIVHNGTRIIFIKMCRKRKGVFVRQWTLTQKCRNKAKRTTHRSITV